MELLKHKWSKNWHAMRWFRLVAALFVFYRMYTMREWLLGIIGLWLLYQAIFNRGCGSDSCGIK